MEELTRVAGPKAAGGRVILAHLGNGASRVTVRVMPTNEELMIARLVSRVLNLGTETTET